MFYVIIGKGYFSLPVYEHDKGVRYEEYLVEHEISSLQAKNVALAFNFDTATVPPGCQPCTKSEMHYCMGTDLVNDHCCCDKRHHEVLSYIPHTCYVGSRICRTVASDCAEYSRIRTCCCDKYAQQKWKEKSSGAAINHINSTAISLLITSIFLYIAYSYI